ncbi:MAG: TetR family transcriptional regulator [Edaphobacter sp.]|uniref:TetR family transcriptional regulator n=1 Tax=Edaphobacter sp. TaxID=1934404 RepID=UPI002389331A|nr:TetR family transcriptional regulator [Edaphobacter sp.]MDE1174976.1 TetR family transcriptional regulator [Edaphobacter sp.]
MTDSLKRRRTKESQRKSSPPHTQERAIQTRQDLLNAARFIFARDGFAVAKLEEIAQAAGKTRGALYANFEDKEDLFFALIAEDLSQDYETYKLKLSPSSSLEERAQVLTDRLVDLVHDRQRMLLHIEFKLFTLRHPHRQERLAELHTAMCYQGSSSTRDLIPELHIEDTLERRRAIASFGAILDGTAINLFFDPIGSSESEIRRKIEREVREHLGDKLHAMSAPPLL